MDDVDGMNVVNGLQQFSEMLIHRLKKSALAFGRWFVSCYADGKEAPHT